MDKVDNVKKKVVGTWLHKAVYEEMWDVAMVLIAHKIDAIKTNDMGETPLMVVASKTISQVTNEDDDFTLLKVFHALISETNIEIPRSSDNYTALHIAIAAQNWPCVRLLLQSGAKVERTTGYLVGQTYNALTLARNRNSPAPLDILEQLITPTIVQPDAIQAAIDLEYWDLMQKFYKCQPYSNDTEKIVCKMFDDPVKRSQVVY